MNGNINPVLFILMIIPVILGEFFLVSFPAESASSGLITATVSVGVCGDNVVQWGEDCDGPALDGQTCQSLGFDAGTLSCDISCSFNKLECVHLGPDEGSAVFSGKAYPWSVIKILKDGQVAATTSADSSGNFEITLSNLIVGSYNFSVYAYDSGSNKSKAVFYTREISKDESEKISGIIIPPTLNMDDDIRQGDEITFSGQATPLAKVTIYLVSSSDNWSLSATAGNNGYYSYELDTDDYDVDDYTVSARVVIGDLISEFGEEMFFEIDKNSQPTSHETKNWKKVDYNDDSRVNLIDFSILVHWFDATNFPSKIDVNKDDRINMSELSIMMHYWTG